MADTPDTEDSIRQRELAAEQFKVNRERRESLAAEVASAREDLADLLVWGSNYGLDVAHMARMAGISRETAHKLLRQVGEPTLTQKLRDLQFEDNDANRRLFQDRIAE